MADLLATGAVAFFNGNGSELGISFRRGRSRDTCDRGSNPPTSSYATVASLSSRETREVGKETS